MGSILEKIEQALKDMLIGWIESNLTNMFTDVNEKVGTIAAEVGQTPSGWNGGVYQMIRGLSENVIVPIAGIIITFVLCYELISMITEKNNLHDMDTWMFFKWFFKAAVAIYLVTHTFDIVMAVFDIGQNVVSGAAGVIHGNTSIDIDATIAQMRMIGFYFKIDVPESSNSDENTPFADAGDDETVSIPKGEYELMIDDLLTMSEIIQCVADMRTQDVKAIREFGKFVPAFAAFEKNRLSLYREAAKEAEEIFDRWADEIDDLDEDFIEDEDYEPDEYYSD